MFATCVLVYPPDAKADMLVPEPNDCLLAVPSRENVLVVNKDENIFQYQYKILSS